MINDRLPTDEVVNRFFFRAKANVINMFKQYCNGKNTDSIVSGHLEEYKMNSF